MTPLMYAASRAANETVAFLLSKGASPDLISNNNATALVLAIQMKCSSTFDLLAPVTTKGLDEAIKWLAAFRTELTPAVENLLRARKQKTTFNLAARYLIELPSFHGKDINFHFAHIQL